MFHILLCICVFGTTFLRGDTSPVFQPQCRSGVCDDRPECPRTTCRCVYPSKVDCSIYYQCVQGKPYQYQCSPGLLFNADTLTCDYDYKVNCSSGKTTESILSTTVSEVTKINDQTTTYTLPNSTEPDNSTTLNPSSVEDTTTAKPTTQADGIITSDTSNTSDPLTTEIDIPSSKPTETPELITTTVQTIRTDGTSRTDGVKTSTSTPNSEDIQTKPTRATDADIIYTDKTPEASSETPDQSTEETSVADQETSTNSEIIYTTSSTNVTDEDIIYTAETPKESSVTPEQPTSEISEADNEKTSTSIYTESSTNQTDEDIISTAETEEVSTTTSNQYKTTLTEITTQKPFTTEIIYTTSAQKNSTADVTPSKMPDFECESRFGLYPDPSNCSTFYHCSHYIPYHKECPSGLHFNPTLTVCDWPNHAGCGEPLSTTVADENPTSPHPHITNDPQCDCDSCVLPVPEDCSSYTQCLDNTSTVIRCGSGLYFNPMIDTCDFQEDVNCDPVECLSPTGQFPYPYSCSHFMDCINGTIVVRTCPEEMVYDEKSMSCSSSATCEGSTTKALDSTTEQQKTVATVTVSSTETTSSENVSPSSPSTTTVVLKSTSTDSETSSTIEQDIVTSATYTAADSKGTDNDNTDQTTEHPSTTILITTTKSKSTEPEDKTTEILSTIENNVTSVTDPDSRTAITDAKDDITTELPYSTKVIITTTTKSSPSATSEDNSSTIKTESTSKSQLTTAKIPATTIITNDAEDEPTSTTNKLETTRDEIVVSTTNEPLTSSQEISKSTTTQFSTEKSETTTSKIPATTVVTNDAEDEPTSTTNKPEATTNETLVSTTNEPITSSQETSKSTATQFSTSAFTSRNPTDGTTTATSKSTSARTTPTDTDGRVGTFECPSRFGLYPDEKNCSMFYQCSHFVPYHKLCPSDLHFNPVLTVCDWPYRAGCVTPLTTVSDQTTAPSTSKPTKDTHCDCDSCELPIPDDCSSYILCIDKVATKITCTSGLLFNAMVGTCDFENNVECEPNVQCPNASGRYPYPRSCAHYMDCADQVMTVRKCPEGMMFDKYSQNCSSSNSCDDPETTLRSTNSDNTSTTKMYPTTTSEKSPITVVTNATTSAGTTTATTTTSDNVTNATVATSPEPVPVTSEQTSTSVPSTRTSTERVPSTNSISTSPSTRITSLQTTPSAYKTTAQERKTTTSHNTTPVRNGTSANPTTFECPSRVGLFPDPESCFYFYHCSHWVPHHKLCPSNLHFNPSLQVCDWPYRAGCNDRSINPTKSDESSPILINGTCKCECCFTPDEKDCSKYLLCLNGTLHEGHCADGLLFNPQNSNCDLAERVNCPKSSSICSSSNGREPNPKNCSSFYNCTNGKAVLQECPKTEHFSVSRKECVEPCEAKCDQTLDCSYKTSSPASHSVICIEDEGLYRAENDCSSYYQCAEGKPYIVKCPYGQHFNVEYGVCEHPCDANCDPNVDCSRQYNYAPEPRLASFHCVTPNGLYPAVQDCGSFYMCSNGKGHLIHCPPELDFNPSKGTCETPCKAGCNVTEECKSENIVTKEPLTTSNATSSPHCKTENGSFPNPNDCGSYYQCINGKERFLLCPYGLHFDIDEKICKSPCIANCDTTLECPIEIPEEDGNCTCEDCFLPDPNDCSAYHFCSNRHLSKGYCPYGTLFDKTTSRCEPEGIANCEAVGDPSMCQEPYGYSPYPGDCKKFVHCVDSIAYVRECEKGLEFDPIVKACSNPNGHCGNDVVDSHCIRSTGLFPHSKNCSLFYQCENGTAYLKECPSPLVFNSIDEVCDWQTNVHCERGQLEARIGKKVSHPKATCNKVPGVTCPCACRVTTYDECSSFYHCQEDGTACKKFCPEGLYFNKRKMVCDLPENVECRDFFFTAMKRMQLWNY